MTAPMETPREHKIHVESIYGHNTRRPAVQVVVPRAARAPIMRPGPTGPVEDRDVFSVQLSVDEARDLALSPLAAAEGAPEIGRAAWRARARAQGAAMQLHEQQRGV